MSTIKAYKAHAVLCADSMDTTLAVAFVWALYGGGDIPNEPEAHESRKVGRKSLRNDIL